LFNITEISDYFLDRAGIKAKDIRYRQNDACIVIYLDKGLIVEKASKGRVSHRQILSVQQEIESKFEMKCEFIFIEDESQSILEKSLGVMLRRDFDIFISLTLTNLTGKSVAIIVNLEENNKGVSSDIEKFLDEILLDSGLSIESISFEIPELEIPSKMALLRIIKVHQPITRVQMLDGLKDYSDADDRWLKRVLDKLRKDSLIIWQRQNRDDKNGCYALTGTGLSIVPAGKYFHSSDIERALALAKRKW
jgi:hypothetical protein